MQLERITKHTSNETQDTWHVIDAEGKRLGRLASEAARLLQGKHRANYSRHQIGSDFVVVLNAAQVSVGRNKDEQKVYKRHTGYLGGLKTETFASLMARAPERAIERAVKGMLPGNRLGRRMLGRLKVYTASTHPHEAQVNAGAGKAKAAAKPARGGGKRAAKPAASSKAEATAEKDGE
ncbi:MAG: 50S ribosomal protein L13 [Chloroflexota bacterium]